MSRDMEILRAIARNTTGVSLYNALLLLDEIKTLDPEQQEIVTPKQWAEAVFTWEDVRNHKIQVIKEIRNRFGLGLRESKDIADAMRPSGLRNFFPPRDNGFTETDKY